MSEFVLLEVARVCRCCEVQARYWTQVFGARRLLEGRAAGRRFVRLGLGDTTLVFTELGPDEPDRHHDPELREHLGLRVADLAGTLARLVARGARVALTPAALPAWMAARGGFELAWVAAPLTPARLAAGEYRHAVAFIEAPDGLWVELNAIEEPSDTGWFRAAPPPGGSP
ncbi:MAG: hypothetical protein H6702_12375 [Myxococcales bacterium]|nr:hypothetical protein [Myxococcales bacterium]